MGKTTDKKWHNRLRSQKPLLPNLPGKTIALDFKNRETADYVRLVCRRKGVDLVQYVLDNFEWDGMPYCLSAFNPGEKITPDTCEGCEFGETCPDGCLKRKVD